MRPIKISSHEPGESSFDGAPGSLYQAKDFIPAKNLVRDLSGGRTQDHFADPTIYRRCEESERRLENLLGRAKTIARRLQKDYEQGVRTPSNYAPSLRAIKAVAPYINAAQINLREATRRRKLHRQFVPPPGSTVSFIDESKEVTPEGWDAYQRAIMNRPSGTPGTEK